MLYQLVLNCLNGGFKGDVQCMFCRNEIKDREHLFFLCGYSKRVWSQLMLKCKVADRSSLLLGWCSCWGLSIGRRLLCRQACAGWFLVLQSTTCGQIETKLGMPVIRNLKIELCRVFSGKWELKLQSNGNFVEQKGNEELCCKWGVDTSVLM